VGIRLLSVLLRGPPLFAIFSADALSRPLFELLQRARRALSFGVAPGDACRKLRAGGTSRSDALGRCCRRRMRERLVLRYR
jgi:hypothetical protein